MTYLDIYQTIKTTSPFIILKEETVGTTPKSVGIVMNILDWRYPYSFMNETNPKGRLPYVTNIFRLFDGDFETKTSFFGQRGHVSSVVWDLERTYDISLRFKHEGNKETIDGKTFYDVISKLYVSSDGRTWTLLGENNTPGNPTIIQWSGNTRFIKWSIDSRTPQEYSGMSYVYGYELEVTFQAPPKLPLLKGILIKSWEFNNAVVYISLEPSTQSPYRFALLPGSALFLEVDKAEKIYVYAAAANQRIHIAML